MGTVDGTLFGTIEESEEVQNDPVQDQPVETEPDEQLVSEELQNDPVQDQPVEPELDEQLVEPLPDIKPIEPVDSLDKDVLESLDQLNTNIQQMNGIMEKTADYGQTLVDDSGSYQWTYKGVTNIAYKYGSPAFTEYFNNESGTFTMASNGDLVRSDCLNLYEEFLFYGNGWMSSQGVMQFVDFPDNESIRGSFAEASDGTILRVEDLVIYEEYIASLEVEKDQAERQAELYEQVNDYLESVDSHLLHLEEMGFADREDFQAVVTACGLILKDNETLGTNLQVIYDSIHSLDEHMHYMSVATTINGFLIALGVGFLIAKLIIGRFK